MLRPMKMTALVIVLLTGVLLTGVLLTGSVQAEEKVDLQFKFTEDLKSTAVIHINLEQTLTLAGMELDSGTDQTSTITTTNGKRDRDGNLQTESVMDAFVVQVKMPMGLQLSFDSANPDAPRPGTPVDALIDLFQAMSDSNWTTHYDQSNRVTKVVGRDASFTNLPAEIRASIAKQFEPEYLQRTENDLLERVPRTSLVKGETWERVETVRLDSTQTMTFTTVYRYEGVVDHEGTPRDKISSKTTKVTLAVAEGAPVKIINSELNVESSEGSFYFDRQIGQIVADREKIHILGELRLEINGMEFPGKLDLTMEESVQRRFPEK